MNIIILKQHFRGKDTIICDGYVMNSCEHWDMSDKDETNAILKRHGVEDSYWWDINHAVEKGEGDADTSDDLAMFAYRFARARGDNPVMHKIVVEAGKPEWAYWYYHLVAKYDDLRQVIIDAGDPQWATYYCRDASDDADMRQVIIDAENPKWACTYAKEVDSNDFSMRQVILDSNNPKWALHYCQDSGKDYSELRKMIVNSNDPSLAFSYCSSVANHEDLRKVIIKAGEPKWACFYCERAKEGCY